MNRNEACSTMFAGAAVALVLLASTSTLAAEPTAAPRAQAPVLVAQTNHVQPGAAATSVDAFPPYQRGVRAAAAQGNEALRRYVWRTRMIYNFRYQDFAPKE